ncbi:hypothetical protein OG264_23110 [Streptomyces xanthophaeus]|uniref:hypothetical protein n=1 Tax=Streptomyces xanthophaeus TaxID=67385 RepID=UPI003869870F|nr:hypothetical protein OG264_23110 [Streptomyces xanthophaeus]WST60898.1 hypothetical protein OG605_15335 [Streptomyces xanthophaeus]
MDSPLHRSADWDQHADRHTQLADPVVTVRQIGRLGLPGRAPTRIDHALVYTTRRGDFEVFLPPHRPRRLRRRYTAVYEVDMGVHPVRNRIPLPSADDAHEFEVGVEFDWQVTDPARYVRSGHRDVPRLLLGELEQAARPVTRRFTIADSAAAENELLTAVGQGKPLGEEAGLRVLWTVRLRRDEENIAHARRLQAIEHEAAEEIRTQQCGSRADREKADRSRAQHEQQLELQEYEARRIAFYREYLTHGGIDAWAMHLAQHPEDSAKALSSLREEQREQLRAQMELIKEMLTKAGTEPFELEGPRRLAIEAFTAVFGQHVPEDPDPAAAKTGHTDTSR